MMQQFDQKAAVQDLCIWADVPRSSLHYKAHPGPRGMKASTHTRFGDGLVENNLVVEQIRAVLQMDWPFRGDWGKVGTAQWGSICVYFESQ